MSKSVLRVLLAGCAALALASSAARADPVVVTMNTVQIFSTIDPAKISDYTDYMASVNLYDGLASVDHQGNLVPELAEKWDVSPDGEEVTFHLRSDAHFQDGTPVEASDVVYSVERLPDGSQEPILRHRLLEDQVRRITCIEGVPGEVDHARARREGS